MEFTPFFKIIVISPLCHDRNIKSSVYLIKLLHFVAFIETVCKYVLPSFTLKVLPVDDVVKYNAFRHNLPGYMTLKKFLKHPIR